MSELSIVSPLDDPERRRKWNDADEQLREIAEQCERGELTDVAVVYAKRDEKVVASWGEYEDRWRLLGALEYAKSCFNNGE